MSHVPACAQASKGTGRVRVRLPLGTWLVVVVVVVVVGAAAAAEADAEALAPAVVCVAALPATAASGMRDRTGMDGVPKWKVSSSSLLRMRLSEGRRISPPSLSSTVSASLPPGVAVALESRPARPAAPPLPLMAGAR
mmetsp:Transcript_105280/g.293096  ORF Transcript_105280/g.293096 Transcript_105280/m.293096 type:complete len:138 (+) Transcript_105280:355-768(+)